MGANSAGRRNEFWPAHVADEARFDSRGECFAAPASAAMRTRTGIAAGDARRGAMEAATPAPNIRSLTVISRTSVMEYRDTKKNLREIGKEYAHAIELYQRRCNSTRSRASRSSTSARATQARATTARPSTSGSNARARIQSGQTRLTTSRGTWWASDASMKHWRGQQRRLR